jgi:hypothetical protein
MIEAPKKNKASTKFQTPKQMNSAPKKILFSTKINEKNHQNDGTKINESAPEKVFSTKLHL